MDPQRLKSIPIFSEMSEQEAHRLAAFATERSVPSGYRLLKDGDYSTNLIAIEEGTADVLKQGRQIGTVGPGDLIGEIGLLNRTHRTADVVATAPMRLIEISHWDIRRMSEETVARIRQLVEERVASDRASEA